MPILSAKPPVAFPAAASIRALVSSLCVINGCLPPASYNSMWINRQILLASTAL